MTDKQLKRLLEIKEEVLMQSNLRYFSNIETSRKFSRGYLSQITQKNLLEIFERYVFESPALKLYSVQFDSLYPVPSGLIILAIDEEQAMNIASETVKHTHVKSVTEIDNQEPRVVFFASGDY